MLHLHSFASSTTSLWVIVVIAATCSIVCLLALARRTRRDRARQTELARWQAEVQVFIDASMTVGARLSRVERGARVSAPVTVVGVPRVVNAAVLSTAQAAVQSESARSGDASHRKALDLAERGAGIDDLVAACDLSRSEAGLVIALQQRGRKVFSAA